MQTSANSDRVISNAYNDLGQKISTKLSEVDAVDRTGNSYSASPETRLEYDAQGNVVKQRVKIDNTTWAETYSYYNALNQKVLEVDPEGYVSAFEFDAYGQLIRQTEYARPLTEAQRNNLNTSQQPSLPATGNDVIGHNRIIEFRYDGLGRQTHQIQVGVTVASLSNAANPDLTLTQSNLTTRQEFDALGNVIKTVNTMGGVTTTAYDALNRAEKTVDVERSVARNDRVDQIRAGGQVRVSPETQFSYDAHGQVIKTQLSSGSSVAAGETVVTYNRYDWHGNAVKRTDGLGHDTFYEYDEQGQVLRESASVNELTRSVPVGYTFTFNGNPISSEDAWQMIFDYRQANLSGAVGTQTEDAVDGHQFLGNLRLPPGLEVTQTTVERTIDYGYAYTRTTEYAYDANGKQIETKVLKDNGEWITQSATYNAFGEMESKGYNGESLYFYAYDKAGRLVSTNQEQGVTSEHAYNLIGHKTQETKIGVHADGTTEQRITRYQYNRRGEVTKTVLPGFTAFVNNVDALATDQGRLQNPVITQTYDRWGNVIKTAELLEDNAGANNDIYAVTEYRFDRRNNVVMEIKPQVEWLGDAYGEEGTLTPTTHYHYNALGAVIATEDAAGHLRKTVVNEAGQQVAAINTLGHRTDMAYDAFGRKVATRNALGFITTENHDANGNITSTGIVRLKHNAPGVTSSASSRFYLSGTNNPQADSNLTEDILFSYQYDALGQRVTEYKGDHAAAGSKLAKRYQYDTRGNVIAVVQNEAETKTFTFDDFGNKTQELNGLGHSLDWTYDRYGKVLTYSDLANRLKTYEYNGFAQVVKETTTSHLAEFDFRHYDYWQDGKLKRMVDERISKVNKDGVVNHNLSLDALRGVTRYHSLQEETYAYSLRGQQVKHVTDNYLKYYNTLYINFAGVVQSQKIDQFQQTQYVQYDAMGRLQKVRVPESDFNSGVKLHALTYHYDKVGNRVSIQRTGSNGANLGHDRTTFDSEGNMLRNGKNRYTYNALGQRVSSLALVNTLRARILDGDGGSTGFPNSEFDEIGPGNDFPRYTTRYTYHEHHYSYNDLGYMVRTDLRSGSRVVDDPIIGGGGGDFGGFALNRASTSLSLNSNSSFTPSQSGLGEETLNWGGFPSQDNSLQLPSPEDNLQLPGFNDDFTNPIDNPGDGILDGPSDGQNPPDGINDSNTGVDDGNSVNPNPEEPLLTIDLGEDPFDSGDLSFSALYTLTTREIDDWGRVTREYAYKEKLNEASKALLSTKLQSRTDSVYNVNDRTWSQTIYSYKDDGSSWRSARINFNHHNSYDAAGNLVYYQQIGYREDNGTVAQTLDYTTIYQRFDSYKQGTAKVEPIDDNSGSRGATTEYFYDNRGHLEKVRAQKELGSNEFTLRHYEYNRNGQIIQERQTVDGTPKHQNYLYVNGQGIADMGTLKDDDFDYQASAAAARTFQSTPSQYVVGKNDTLKGIAQSVYGDASLWYAIADRNAIASDAELREGMALTIPDIATNANNAATFKPYNPGDIIGNTTPSVIPPPPPENCGTLGAVIMVAVMIVVTVYTAGLLGPAVAGASGTMGAGAAILGGSAGFTMGTVGAAFAAGFAGSAASQVVGKAMGNVESFSLRQAVSSGFTSVATMGLGYLSQAGEAADAQTKLDAIGKAKTADAATKAAKLTKQLAGYSDDIRSASSAAKTLGGVLNWGGGAVSSTLSVASSVAANKLAGVTGNFNWSTVVASYVASNATGTQVIDNDKLRGAAGRVQGVLSQAIDHQIRKERGKETSWNNRGVWANAFGSLLGNAIVSGLQKMEHDDFVKKKIARFEAEQKWQDVANPRRPMHSPIDASSNRGSNTGSAHANLTEADFQNWINENYGGNGTARPDFITYEQWVRMKMGVENAGKKYINSMDQELANNVPSIDDLPEPKISDTPLPPVMDPRINEHRESYENGKLERDQKITEMGLEGYPKRVGDQSTERAKMLQVRNIREMNAHFGIDGDELQPEGVYINAHFKKQSDQLNDYNENSPISRHGEWKVHPDNLTTKGYAHGVRQKLIPPTGYVEHLQCKMSSCHGVVDFDASKQTFLDYSFSEVLVDRAPNGEPNAIEEEIAFTGNFGVVEGGGGFSMTLDSNGTVVLAAGFQYGFTTDLSFNASITVSTVKGFGSDAADLGTGYALSGYVDYDISDAVPDNMRYLKYFKRPVDFFVGIEAGYTMSHDIFDSNTKPLFYFEGKNYGASFGLRKLSNKSDNIKLASGVTWENSSLLYKADLGVVGKLLYFGRNLFHSTNPNSQLQSEVNQNIKNYQHKLR